jgi:hypothetical protein
MSQSLNDCIAGCNGLSDEHGFLRKSPYQICVAACKKGSRHDTGFGDPDEIFNVDVQADLEASVSNMPGDLNVGGGNGDESSAPSPQSDPKVIFGAVALIAGLIFMGSR